MGQDR
jgi:hypothetical protein